MTPGIWYYTILCIFSAFDSGHNVLISLNGDVGQRKDVTPLQLPLVFSITVGGTIVTHNLF